MKQRRWLGTTITLILIAMVLIAVPSVAALPRAQSFSASLTPIAGLVQYLPSGRSQWINVTQVTLINEGDQIRTADDGVARLSVVTGIEVELYPTTWVVLNDLSLGQGTNDALIFSLGQMVGSTFVTVNQELDANDRVQVLTPAASASVRGTKFYVLVTPDLEISFVSGEDEVEVETVDGQTFTVSPNDIVRILLDIDPAPAICTAQFITDNSDVASVVRVVRTEADGATIREFLLDALTSNVNPEVRSFLRDLLALESIDFSGLGDDDDQAELQELLQALNNYNATDPELPDILVNFRAFEESYLAFLTGGKSTAPNTCGNGRQDAGETAENCAVDTVNVAASCGNNLCETERQDLGESLLNCPEDCMPPGNLALSCISIVGAAVNPPRPTNVPPPGQTSRPPTNTPIPPPTNTPPPPPPSGIGR